MHFLARSLVCPYIKRGSHEEKACDPSKIIFKVGLKKKKTNTIANLQKHGEFITFSITLFKISF